jgi:hypothetical protein
VDQSSVSSRKSEKRNYKARFTKESFNENFVVEQGQVFEKTWTFKNDGTDSWPEDTRLAFTNGDQFGEAEKKVPKEVKVGEFCEIAVQFTAP